MADQKNTATGLVLHLNHPHARKGIETNEFRSAYYRCHGDLNHPHARKGIETKTVYMVSLLQVHLNHPHARKGIETYCGAGYEVHRGLLAI